MIRVLVFILILFSAAPALAEVPAAQVKSYAELAYKSYQSSYADSLILEKSVAAFADEPSEENRKGAQDAWLKLRTSYAETEVFRFADGPADEKQGQLNQWPVSAEFINNLLADNKFEITAEKLLARNQEFDELQVTTGLNVIEYFLWKKEMKTEREKEYLRVVTELASADLKALEEAWEPVKEGNENYGKEFLGAEPKQSLGKMMLGLTVLSGFELAANRLENHSSREDYSALSKNTKEEFAGALKGVRNVYFGAGLNVPVQDADKTLADKIAAQMQHSENLVATTPLTENAAARKALVDSLQIQAGLFKQAAAKLSLSIDDVAE